MTHEERELEALQLIEATSRSQHRQSVRVRCGVVEDNGKLLPLTEFVQRNEMYRPPGREAPTVTLVCGGTKGCQQGDYPERSPQNKHLYPGAPTEPHCGCYHRLKQQYGKDALPECTKAYSPKLAVDKDVQPKQTDQ